MRPRFPGSLSIGLFAVALGALLSSAACSSSSSSSSTTGGTTGSGGGPVEGPVDAHCGSTVQVVSQAACSDPGTGGSTGAGGSATGSGGAGGMMEEETAEVMYNAEGDDDDCKFHMKWSASGVGQSQDVTFTLTLTNKSDGKPATGAAPDIEAFLDDTHPAPNSDQKTSEGANGIYTIGPMRFDASGKWTVRFHVYETCSDLNEGSPHGHGAFYLQVP